MITKQEALDHLHSEVTDTGLREHCQNVGRVMEFLARHFHCEADAEKWLIAGLLHDADWEKYPSEHPARIVSWVSARGEKDIAHAISAHGVSWGVNHESLMDKALVGTDELCGFIVAYARIRPGGIGSMTPTKVVKKLLDRGFAAGVDRHEVYQGAKILGLPVEEIAALIITALQ